MGGMNALEKAFDRCGIHTDDWTGSSPYYKFTKWGALWAIRKLLMQGAIDTDYIEKVRQLKKELEQS